MTTTIPDRAPTAADCVLTGGKIWRGLGLGFAAALAIRDGQVLASGTAAEIAPLIGPGTRVIELSGRLAVPGFNDAHLHLLPFGLAMTEVDLRPEVAPTLDAMLAALRARAAVIPPGEWVIGRGYDQFELDVKRHPTRDELDAACPDHPVYIVRTCGHLAVANTPALALAGIDEATPSPEGGLIERQDGRLTGLLAETGCHPVMAVLPVPSVEAMVDAIERGGRALLRHGITSCMDAAVGLYHGWPEMAAYRRAHTEGRLPVRVYATLMGDKTRSILPEAMAAGLVTGVGDDMLRIGGVKIFTDGSTGGRTAAMSRPYLGGRPDDLGLLCIPDDAELRAMVLDAHRAGYQLAIHAIGDRAIEQVLGALEAALLDTPAPDHRHRIEHCGWLTADQLERLRRQHILPAPQPAFIYAFGDLYLELVEAERAAASYPMRSWVEAGLHPSASTDCPVTGIAPWPNLYTMVTRRTRRGTVLGPEQRLSLDEALDAYSWAAAYAAREEGQKGRLVAGQLADIAVLNRDLFTLEPEAWLETRCDLTILGGEVVFEREGTRSSCTHRDTHNP